MNPSHVLVSLVALVLLGGCAACPVNPPITQADPRAGYRFETRQAEVKNKNNLVVLALSGGGAAGSNVRLAAELVVPNHGLTLRSSRSRSNVGTTNDCRPVT